MQRFSALTLGVIGLISACGGSVEGRSTGGDGAGGAGGAGAASTGGVSQGTGGVSQGTGGVLQGTGGGSQGTGGISQNTGGATSSCAAVTIDPAYVSQRCNNPADRCYFSAHASEILDDTMYCATIPAPNGCIQYAATPESPEAIQCMVSCLIARLTQGIGSSVSEACAECFQAVTTCEVTYCLSECIPAPTSAACRQCLCQPHSDSTGSVVGNCVQDVFAQCAGFRPPDTEVGCGG